MWGTFTGGSNHKEIHYKDGYRKKITKNSKSKSHSHTKENNKRKENSIFSLSALAQ
jgi:hypothetical protein